MVRKHKLHAFCFSFYCFIVISIDPTIDSRSIIEVSKIKRGKLVYMILPIVVI